MALFSGNGMPRNCFTMNRYKVGEPVGFRVTVVDGATGQPAADAEVVVHLTYGGKTEDVPARYRGAGRGNLIPEPVVGQVDGARRRADGRRRRQRHGEGQERPDGGVEAVPERRQPPDDRQRVRSRARGSPMRIVRSRGTLARLALTASAALLAASCSSPSPQSAAESPAPGSPAPAAAGDVQRLNFTYDKAGRRRARHGRPPPACPRARKPSCSGGRSPAGG